MALLCNFGGQSYAVNQVGLELLGLRPVRISSRSFPSIFFAAAVLIIVGENVAASDGKLQPLPTTADGNYAVAERFAQCSGHFAFAAFIAQRNGLTDSATAFGDMQRGWKLAGMFFLAESMARDRAKETERTFANLVANKVSVMKGKFEIDPKGSNEEFQREYQKNCGPWVETQKKIIELIRRG